MAFEDLREQLRERAAEAMAKIQETSAFNTLRERYESQTPPVQRAIMAGAALFALYLVMLLPMSYISSSSDALSQFEENRELIQGLLKASRSSKEPPPLPPPMPFEGMKAGVERTLRDSGLLPDQIGLIEAIPEDGLKGLAPPGVVITGLVARLKKLNLTQVVEIGNFLQNMAPGMKLIATDILQTAGTTHYYDLTVQLVSFGLPTFADEDAGAKDTGKKPPGRARSRNATDELEGE